MDHRSDIAVIGLSCVFPGADSAACYWNNILKKRRYLDEAPDAWALPSYAPDSDDETRIYTRRVGLLGKDALSFDPIAHGTSPSAVQVGEPDQFLALKEATRALADSGYDRRAFNRQKTGVILGRGASPSRSMTNGLLLGLALDQFTELLQKFFPDADGDVCQRVRAELKSSLVPFSAESAPGMVSNVAAGRIANRLDLWGTSHVVDAACASSLIAVDQAMGELRSHRADMMLAGGIQGAMAPMIYMLFCRLNALSRTMVKPFDAAANGTLLAEGAGFVVLKRLADAERDDDRIYAVLKSVGTASNGKELGLLAPGMEGERLAMQRAYDEGGLKPSSVQLIEAHGTGIPLGDRTEISAMRAVFGERAKPLPSCAIGSVKSMIGHAIPASGMASLIKTVLALHHRILPPTLCDTVHPELGLDATPFYVNSAPRPWVHGELEAPRRAGINAFGFGGINAHAIVEEYTGSHRQPQKIERSSELVCLSADSREALIAAAEALEAYLNQNPDTELADLAFTLSEAEHGDCRLAIVAATTADLRDKLAKVKKPLSQAKRKKFKTPSDMHFCADARAHAGAKTAFLFPGQGSQYAEMLGDLYPLFPQIQNRYDVAEAAMRGEWDILPSHYLFPPPTGLSEDQQQRLAEELYAIDISTDLVFTAGLALYDLLVDFGLEADALVGHSTGEYTSLAAAQAFETASPEALIETKRRLNRLFRSREGDVHIPRGVLLSVGGLGRAQVEAELAKWPGRLHVAVDNCPNQRIIFGDAEAIDGLSQACRAAGAACSTMPYGYAYHTPLMADQHDSLAEYYRQLDMQAPSKPLYSCVTGKRFPGQVEASRELAAKQWSAPVRFRETIEQLHDEGVRHFIEVGPNNVLTAFVDDTLRGRPYVAIASNLATRPGLDQLNSLLAQLFVLGKTPNLAPTFAARRPQRLDFKAESPSKTAFSAHQQLNPLLPRISLSDDYVQQIRPQLERCPPAPGATPPTSVGPSTPAQAATVDPPMPSTNAGSGAADIVRRHHDLMREFLDHQKQTAESLFRQFACQQARENELESPEDPPHADPSNHSLAP